GRGRRPHHVTAGRRPAELFAVTDLAAHAPLLAADLAAPVATPTTAHASPPERFGCLGLSHAKVNLNCRDPPGGGNPCPPAVATRSLACLPLGGPGGHARLRVATTRRRPCTPAAGRGTCAGRPAPPHREVCRWHAQRSCTARRRKPTSAWR